MSAKAASPANDMTVGTEWKQILLFALPIMAGQFLQQLYNTVDGIVVGNYVNEAALGAVGACTSLALLFLALSNGFSMGCGVMISQLFGAKRMVLISDSLRCCGMPNGEYELGGQAVFMEDGLARLADGTIAGSAIDLFEILRRAVSFGIPKEDAILAATRNPARQIGCLDKVGTIADGKIADFVICDEELNRKAVYIAGQKI